MTREELQETQKHLSRALSPCERRFTPRANWGHIAELNTHSDVRWVPLCLLWHSGGVQFASLFSTFFFHSSAIQEHTITIITPAGSLIKINCYSGTTDHESDGILASRTIFFLFVWGFKDFVTFNKSFLVGVMSPEANDQCKLKITEAWTLQRECISIKWNLHKVIFRLYWTLIQICGF